MVRRVVDDLLDAVQCLWPSRHREVNIVHQAKRYGRRGR